MKSPSGKSPTVEALLSGGLPLLLSAVTSSFESSFSEGDNLFKISSDIGVSLSPTSLSDGGLPVIFCISLSMISSSSSSMNGAVFSVSSDLLLFTGLGVWNGKNRHQKRYTRNFEQK